MVARPSRSLPATEGIHEYLIEEDEMGDSTAQSRLMDYLVEVLRWLYRSDGWFVARNLTCYHPAIANSQQMISPDIAVFTGIPLTAEQQWELTSWDMRRAGHACPPVMLEVSSAGTWHTDIDPGRQDKPHIYGAIGARAYFAYDPNRRRVWRQRSGRLLGWRYDAAGQPVALTPDGRGWLWSDELQSWLAPAGPLLHLYDGQGRRRLTEAAAREEEAREAQAQVERERRARQDAQAQAERERRARAEAEAQAETERRARQDAERARAEAEAARAEAEAAHAEEARRRGALEEELRRLRQGRDPEA